MSQRKLLVGIVGVFLAILSLGFLLSRNGPRNTEPFLAEQPMADGIHRLRLLKIVEGPMVYDWKDPTPPLLRMLPLPPKLRPKHVPFARVKSDGVMPSFGMAGGDVPAVNFLFRVVDAKGDYAAFQPGRPEMTLVESTGHRFEKPFHAFDHAIWGTINCKRGVVPRRDRTLKIEMAFKNSGKPPLVFEVENPLYRPPVEEWVPEALPSTKQFDGIDVTLRSPGPISTGGHMTSVDLRSSNSGLRGNFGAYWIEDATGNRGEGLSPFEPAWKLHGRMTPQLIEALPRDEIWTIDDIAVPPLGVENALNLEREIHGVKLKLGSIIGGAVGTGEKNNKDDGPIGKPRYRPDCPKFSLTAEAPRSDFEVVIQVSHNGERLLAFGDSETVGLKRSLTRVFKKLPADSKIRIEIGVGRPVDVEFLVAPKDFKYEPERLRKSNKPA